MSHFSGADVELAGCMLPQLCTCKSWYAAPLVLQVCEASAWRDQDTASGTVYFYVDLFVTRSRASSQSFKPEKRLMCCTQQYLVIISFDVLISQEPLHAT